YPRTDSQFITDQEFKYLKDNLDRYLQIYNLQPRIEYEKTRKRSVYGSKVQEHYAINLTKNVKKTDIQGLNEKESNIFREIYNTTISMFLPDYEYETTEVITTIKNYEFHSKGKIDLAQGWRELFKNDPEKEQSTEEILPKLFEDDIVSAKPEMYEGITKPPNLYTEGQL